MTRPISIRLTRIEFRDTCARCRRMIPVDRPGDLPLCPTHVRVLALPWLLARLISLAVWRAVHRRAAVSPLGSRWRRLRAYLERRARAGSA